MSQYLLFRIKSNSLILCTAESYPLTCLKQDCPENLKANEIDNLSGSLNQSQVICAVEPMT